MACPIASAELMPGLRAMIGTYAKHLPNVTVRPIPGANHSFTDGLPELVGDIRSLEEAR
jgi:hypothetical protein